MESFTRLRAWQIGILLMKEIYAITEIFPKSETYGLTSQMRRSATSCLANIAEGCGRYTYADKANKFVIARGECTETHAFLLMAVALELLNEKQARNAIALLDELRRVLSGLIRSCRRKG